ncbi:MAG: hypothetical protein JO248_07425 [Acidimicrobiia bacterium]|nr:hypothetical protein [Acidimicrobiia bacterium]
MLRVTFVRKRGQRDRVYVQREDGSSTGWDFPTYGDALPHDLMHLVVEDALGMRHGFWGLVDAGVEVALVANEATLVRGAKPLTEDPGADLEGLLDAERVVTNWTAFARGGADGTEHSPPDAGQVGEALASRLRTAQREWRELADGESISLIFNP